MAFVKTMNNDNSLEMGYEFLGNCTISNILGEVSMIDDVSKKSAKLEFYVHLMEDEMLKIDGLKRELPFCINLLKDGIKMLNKERLKCMGKGVGPVMAEFISWKSDGIERSNLSNDINEKKNWLSSAQLWTASVEYEGHQLGDSRYPKSFDTPRPYHQEEKGDGHENQLLKMPNMLENRAGAFMQYKRQHGGVSIDNGKRFAMLPPPSAAEAEPNKKRPEKKQMRRCWSPKLHKRFVDALHQLGGAKMATPKQIRDLMQVEGLTSDEVKSHLQKYRMHLRKLESSERDDPSPKLTMAIVSPQCHSIAIGASSSKVKSDGEEHGGF